MPGFPRRIVAGTTLWALILSSAAAQSTAPRSSLAYRSEVRCTIAESAILDWLRAVTPRTVTVGSSSLSADLVLSDPKDLVLRDGEARLKIRVKGRTVPIGTDVSAAIRLGYDPHLRKYFATVSAMPIEIPGLGTLDLKDALPRIEIPGAVRHLLEFAGQPVGLELRIRRVAIVEHAVEIAADVSFSRASPAAAR